MDAGRVEFSPDSFARPAFFAKLLLKKKKPLLEGGGEAEQGLAWGDGHLADRPVSENDLHSSHFPGFRRNLCITPQIPVILFSLTKSAGGRPPNTRRIARRA